MSTKLSSNKNIAIIGLGYVGLPLAVEFSKKYNTIGFDINKERVKDLNKGIDKTKEISTNVLLYQLKKKKLLITDKIDFLKICEIFIITVPTPIDNKNNPDLQPLINASEFVGSLIKKGDIIVYESTVYPGVTEDICRPIIEKTSNLIYNKDFFLGYSPERINPGDKVHTLTNIKKITSGSNKKTANIVNSLYSSIINAGTYMASSIKVAEAAKIIENAQRDINIAFVNELSKIFNLMNISTKEVLEAASTKWNFLKFNPGLVGGHCIGVDPYYLAQKAQEIGYHPEIILAGRRINDGMGKYIANEVIKKLINKEILVSQSNILILGFTFKENCPDIRNTKVIDIIKELNLYNVNMTVVDPLALKNEVAHEYGIKISNTIPKSIKFDAIIITVAHNLFLNLNLKSYLKSKGVVYDVKRIFNDKIIDGGL